MKNLRSFRAQDKTEENRQSRRQSANGEGRQCRRTKHRTSRIPGNSTSSNGSDARPHATALENTQEKLIHLSHHKSRIITAVNGKITKVQARWLCGALFPKVQNCI